MSDNEDKLLRIEQSIINKIEKKTDKFEKKMDNFSKKVENFGKDFGKGFNIKLSSRKTENLSSRQKYELKKHNIKAGWKSHLTAYLSVNAFLIFIWIVSGMGFPWFFFPAAGWGIGLFSHLASSKSELKKLDIMYKYRDKDGTDNQNYIDNSTKSLTGEKSTANRKINKIDDYSNLKEPYLSYIKDSNELSSSLMSQINESKNVDTSITEEIKTTLVHYTDKINYLAKRGNILDEAINYYDQNPIEEHRASIEKELENEETDESVKREYTNALKQLEKQESSIDKLKKVRDTVNAKLKTSLIILRNLQLDFVRLQYISDESASDAIQSLNKKTEEIDEYIDLLSDSLKDIDSQI